MQLPNKLRRIIGMSYDRDQVGSWSDYSISGPADAPSSMQLRVPFVPQRHVNLCSDACAIMIAQAWGEMTITNTKTNPRGAFESAEIKDHQPIAGRIIDWKEIQPSSAWGIKDYLYYMAAFGPLGCFLKGSIPGTMHYVVLIGGSEGKQTVTLHDPWKGPFRQMTVTNFRKDLDELTYLNGVGGREGGELQTRRKWRH